MAYSESYCDSYFQRISTFNPTYIWGANLHQITDMSEAKTLYNTYGSSSGKYNQEYYNQKVQYALANSQGYASDCSGFFIELSDGHDFTAQGFYNNCTSKGNISSIDLSHSCLVFRGSTTKISHVGFYCRDGYTYEMANSDDNFRRQKFNPNNWTYWGRPHFIDYSSAPIVPMKTYLYKGIDMSTYQKSINYQALKDAGVDFAILKIINKQGNKDDMFDIHVSALDTLGIKIQGVYNYSYATTIDKAVSDANKVLQYLGNRQCAVCLDVEDNCQKTLGYGLIDIINTYQTVIENAGRSFILYTGKSFYETYIKPYASNLRLRSGQLWIARYYRGYNEMPFENDPDDAYKPMDGILAWQYTSSGSIKGINTRLDLNVMYKEIESPSSSPIIIPTPSVKLNSLIKNTVSTNGKNLNVRNRPSTETGQIIGKLPNNANVIIYGTDKSGLWGRISVPKDEWISLSWINSTGRGMVTAEKSLYVRSSDSKSGEIWGVYKSGEVVTILHRSTNTGWYLTVGKNKDGILIGGWCSDKYITTK